MVKIYSSQYDFFFSKFSLCTVCVCVCVRVYGFYHHSFKHILHMVRASRFDWMNSKKTERTNECIKLIHFQKGKQFMYVWLCECERKVYRSGWKLVWTMCNDDGIHIRYLCGQSVCMNWRMTRSFIFQWVQIRFSFLFGYWIGYRCIRKIIYFYCPFFVVNFSSNSMMNSVNDRELKLEIFLSTFRSLPLRIVMKVFSTSFIFFMYVYSLVVVWYICFLSSFLSFLLAFCFVIRHQSSTYLLYNVQI